MKNSKDLEIGENTFGKESSDEEDVKVNEEKKQKGIRKIGSTDPFINNQFYANQPNASKSSNDKSVDEVATEIEKSKYDELDEFGEHHEDFDKVVKKDVFTKDLKK